MKWAEFLRLSFTWRDAIEIVVVAFVVYRVLRFFAGTRALQVVVGAFLLAGAYVVAVLLKFTMITYLLGLVFTYGAFALLIVFQPELRTALARLGQSRFFGRLAPSSAEAFADEVAESVDRLSRNGTGAIIVIEREVGLGEYLVTGSSFRASVSADLITTIFSPYAPLHDGAIIISGNEIIGAGCILPLSQRALPDRSLGTRHRAALGLAEETDAVVIVVSEETSQISIARRGALYRPVAPDQVRAYLMDDDVPPAASAAPAKAATA